MQQKILVPSPVRIARFIALLACAALLLGCTVRRAGPGAKPSASQPSALAINSTAAQATAPASPSPTADFSSSHASDDNEESPRMRLFREQTSHSGLACAPRRPTKFQLSYERTLLQPPDATEDERAKPDKSSLQKDDAILCEQSHLWFELEQALPDATPLAMGRRSFLVSSPAGTIIYEYDARRGWLVAASFAAESVAATYLEEADEYVALMQHKVVALRRVQSREQLPVTDVKATQWAWRVAQTLADPDRALGAPPSSLHAAGNELVWWSAKARRGYVFARNAADEWAHAQTLRPNAPLRTDAVVTVASATNDELVLRVRQTASGPDTLQYFYRGNGSLLEGERDMRWFYLRNFNVAAAPQTFTAVIGSPWGLIATARTGVGDGHVAFVADLSTSADAPPIQRLAYLSAIAPVAIDYRVLILDCTDDVEGPSTCLLRRNLHDHWESYSHTVGLRPLAYRDGVLLGRDTAGPGATARLVVLKH